MTSRARQRGVALIVALLVVALAAVLIAALLSRGELTAARTRNLLRDRQAAAYAKGLEAYAAHVLMQDLVRDETDTADDIWAVPLMPTPVPGGNIAATMVDLNGRFNLNNLANPQSQNNATWKELFTRLLITLKLDPGLAQNVQDWMNQDASSGSGDAWYAGQSVPYRSSHRMFSHVSELRLVKGIDGDTYARLLPHVTALPVGTRINVNTATVPVLTTLTPGFTEQEAGAIWQEGHAHFQSIPRAGSQTAGSSTAQLPAPDHPDCFDVRSSYFLARGDIQLDGIAFTFYSLIERRQDGTNGANNGPRVLQRSRGGD